MAKFVNYFDPNHDLHIQNNRIKEKKEQQKSFVPPIKSHVVTQVDGNVFWSNVNVIIFLSFRLPIEDELTCYR